MCTDSSASLAGGPMQRGHSNGSYIMPEFFEVGYSATLARAQRHNFKGCLHWGKVLAVEGSECTIKWQTDKEPSSHSSTDVFLTAFHSIPSSDGVSEAPLYLESDHEATDRKTSLRSAAQQTNPTQSDPANLFLLVSCALQRANHVPVLRCLPAIVINSLEPIRTHQLVLQPLSTTKASCASVAQWQVPTPSLHYPSSSRNVKCTATAHSESASGIGQSCWQ